jgi:hypothetical protein
MVLSFLTAVIIFWLVAKRAKQNHTQERLNF